MLNDTLQLQRYHWCLGVYIYISLIPYLAEGEQKKCSFPCSFDSAAAFITVLRLEICKVFFFSAGVRDRIGPSRLFVQCDISHEKGILSQSS